MAKPATYIEIQQCHQTHPGLRWEPVHTCDQMRQAERWLEQTAQDMEPDETHTMIYRIVRVIRRFGIDPKTRDLILLGGRMVALTALLFAGGCNAINGFGMDLQNVSTWTQQQLDGGFNNIRKEQPAWHASQR